MATATFLDAVSFVYPCIDFVLLAFIIGFVGAFCSYTVAHRLHTTLKIFPQFFLNFVQILLYFFLFAGHAGIHMMRMMRGVNVTARCNFLVFSRHWENWPCVLVYMVDGNIKNVVCIYILKIVRKTFFVASLGSQKLSTLVKIFPIEYIP